MTTQDFPWPSGAGAAVSLSFDDAMPSHWGTVAPMLAARGMGGTFYVNPREDFLSALAPARRAQERGHEIGNHTVTHPCSGAFGFHAGDDRRPLEELRLEDIDRDIALAQTRLDELCPAQGRVSFAYPCYQTFVGRGRHHQSYVPVVPRHCIAGRTRGERMNEPWTCDLFHLGSFPCEGMTGAELIGMAEQCVQQRRWLIYTFHGVGEGHLAVETSALEALVDHLAARRDAIWTGTVKDVATHIHDQTAADQAV